MDQEKIVCKYVCMCVCVCVYTIYIILFSLKKKCWVGEGGIKSFATIWVKLEEVTLSEISQRKAILQDITYVSNLCVCVCVYQIFLKKTHSKRKLKSCHPGLRHRGNRK